MSQKTESRSLWIVIIVVGLALYFASFFPVASMGARFPATQRLGLLYRPIPRELRGEMFQLWKQVDPAGYRMSVDRVLQSPALLSTPPRVAPE